MEDGRCDCCGKLVARNPKTGKVFTKEEIEKRKNDLNKKDRIEKWVVR